jgi:choline monooxygenase
VHLDIDPDIRRARTPPTWLYTRPDVHDALLERVLWPSWQLVPEAEALVPPVRAVPFTLLPGTLEEPLLLARADDGIARCLANVCTHRANVLLDGPSTAAGLRCGYHGRRFALDGRCQHMPEFEEVRDFPASDDHLREIPLARLGPFTFASLAPVAGLADHLGSLPARLSGLLAGGLRRDTGGDRAFEFDANWLLYVENYLEGFHIPYVHPALARRVEFASYVTELQPRASVQIAAAVAGDPVLPAPPGHPDHGRALAAYYVWLWPNTMLNLYPWGCSVNVVQPLGVARTRVRFLRYVADAAILERGAGSGLDDVELEDETIVQRVQRGVRARCTVRGRYAPRREQGVHHFHRLLAAALAPLG